MVALFSAAAKYSCLKPSDYLLMSEVCHTVSHWKGQFEVLLNLTPANIKTIS